jgi:hypothetical protein
LICIAIGTWGLWQKRIIISFPAAAVQSVENSTNDLKLEVLNPFAAGYGQNQNPFF